MKRMAFFIYGVTGHLLFLATYAWLAGFVGNLLVPHSIDSPASDPVPLAVAIDLGLIALFGLQHSIMARPAFKRIWTRIVPQPIERSTYVLASCAVTLLLIWQWRAVDLVVWDVRGFAAEWLLYGLFAVGWLGVPVVSLMIHHFDLFGTRQVWLYLQGREYTPLPFRTPLLYAKVRHPLYVAWAIAFWATPIMTVGHLLFAVGMTTYMLLAVVFEERDLIAYFGHQYEEYRRRVPMFVPWRSVVSSSPRLDWHVLSDPSWLHWAITVPLLAAYLSGIAWALPVVMALCVALTGYYFIQLRSVKPFPVQIRLAYAMLLAVGMLPGLSWIHWVQLAGTTAMITTGYCMLGRVLSLLSFNRAERLSWLLVQRVLLSRAAVGGLVRWPVPPPETGAFAIACCSMQGSSWEAESAVPKLGSQCVSQTNYSRVDKS